MIWQPQNFPVLSQALMELIYLCMQSNFYEAMLSTWKTFIEPIDKFKVGRFNHSIKFSAEALEH